MAKISDRIRQGLEIKEMKQSDLVKITGIGKSSISTYISGSYEPKQKNIYKIAKALNVNEAWLMGYDVPMERNEYKDPRIIERDTILENIEKVLEIKNWSLFCDTYDDDFFIIKDAIGQTITSFYDYDLIARYKSLQKKGKVTADLLVSSKSAFFKYLESLGYYIGRDDPEHKPFIHYGNGAVKISDNMLDDVRTRIDTYAKATMDSAVLKLNEDSLRKKREEKERLTAYLLANAAHARTNIDIPKDTDTSDDDTMDDEDF